MAERLTEREALRDRLQLSRVFFTDDGMPAVDCYRWSTRYLVGKEALWLAYFVLHRSWAALAGVGLFLVYPLWRRIWRGQHPFLGGHS